MEEKQQHELSKMLALGNKFDVVITQGEAGLFNDNAYQVIFIGIGGTKFVWSLQKRVDRKNGIRLFKSIDNAVKQIRLIGYRGDITVRLD